MPTLPRSEDVLDTYFVKDREEERKTERESRRKGERGMSKDQRGSELPGDADTWQGRCRDW